MRCKWGKIHAPSYSVRALSVPRKGGSNHWRFGWLATPEKNTNIDSQWFLDVKTLCFFGWCINHLNLHLILASWEGKSRLRTQTLKNFPTKILAPKFQKKASFWKGMIIEFHQMIYSTHFGEDSNLMQSRMLNFDHIPFCHCWWKNSQTTTSDV